MSSHRSGVIFISFGASNRERQVVEKNVHALTPFAHTHQPSLATQIQLVRRDANICAPCGYNTQHSTIYSHSSAQDVITFVAKVLR